VFIGSCNGLFRALDRRTGTLVWEHDTREENGPFEFHSDPLVSGSLIFVGSDLRSPGATAYVYAFERETGAVRWKTDVDLGAATDLLEFGRLVLAVTIGDELVAFDRETGERVWSFASGAKREDLGPLNSSPAILRERVFFGGFNGILYALDPRTGRVLWRRDLGSRVSAGVVAGEEGVYVGTLDGRMNLVNPENGEIVTRIATEGIPTGRLALAGKCVLGLLEERALVCYARRLERVNWLRAGAKPWTSSRPYAFGNLAIVGDEDGTLSAFELTDGKIAWLETFGGTIRGVGGSRESLYVGTLQGAVHARGWPRVGTPTPARPTAPSGLVGRRAVEAGFEKWLSRHPPENAPADA
jgi:outer membrane protein assembly factor BamB